MSNPNPLIPQGSLLEQQAKSKPHLRIALCIVAIHLVFLGGLLMQGCKRDEPTTSGLSATNDLPPLDSASVYSNPPPGSLAGDPLPGFGAGTTSTSAPPSYAIGTPQPTPSAYAPPAYTPPAYTPPVDAGVPAPSAQEYVVVKGDSFYSIGRKFGVTASAIARANPGVDSTRLRIGQKLQIPAASTVGGAAPMGSTAGGGAAVPSSDVYVVKAGDTLLKISRSHGVSVAAIKEINGLKTDRINVGQKLRLPGRETAPAPAPAPLETAPFGTPAGGTAPAPAPFPQ